jgi:hypothetical protein
VGEARRSLNITGREKKWRSRKENEMGENVRGGSQRKTKERSKTIYITTIVEGARRFFHPMTSRVIHQSD